MEKPVSLLSFCSVIIKLKPLLLSFVVLLLLVQSAFVTLSLVSIAPVIDLYLHPGLENASDATVNMVQLIESLSLTPNLKTFTCTLIILLVLKNSILVFVRYFLLKIQYEIVLHLAMDTFYAVFDANWYYFTGSKQGTFLNTFTLEINRIGTTINYLGRLFTNVTQVLILCIVPMLVSWQITLICMSLAALFLIPIFFFSKLLQSIGTDNTQTSNKLASTLKEVLDGAKIIRGFGTEQKGLSLYRTAFNMHKKVTLKFQSISNSQNLIYEPLSFIALAITIGFIDQENISPASAAVAIFSLKSVLPLVGDTVSIRNIIKGHLPSYAQLQSLKNKALDEKIETLGYDFSGFNQEIRIESATFAYPDSLSPVLNDVSVRIEKGSFVAFVGTSGSGKSTLIDLIMGMNEPKNGSILVDGVPLQRYDLSSYRRAIGFVPQDPVLFNTSILDNVRWAKTDATMAEVNEALNQAYAAEFISKLSEGLYTVVGDRGVRLSGGQCQRLALARALICDPQILILDEATSALDTQSERYIQSAISDLIQDQSSLTVITIAHRLSTVVLADNICVLSNGRIVENGTYAELVSLGGHFSEMVKAQEV